MHERSLPVWLMILWPILVYGAHRLGGWIVVGGGFYNVLSTFLLQDHVDRLCPVMLNRNFIAQVSATGHGPRAWHMAACTLHADGRCWRRWAVKPTNQSLNHAHLAEDVREEVRQPVVR